METLDTPEGKQTRKKNYVPDDDKDFQLCGVRIEDAENGVVVRCQYKLKPEVEAKMRKSEQRVPYYGDNDESHVFEEKQAAKDFINGELDELFGLGEGRSEEHDEE